MSDDHPALPDLPVRVDFDGIVAAWENGGEVWVGFAPDRPAGPGLFDAMGEGLEAANEALDPDGFGAGVHGTVVGGAMKLKHPPSERALRDWLAVFAERVRTEGWGGAVHKAPAIHRLDWLIRLNEPRLTVYASYEATIRDRIGPELCAAAVQWARRTGGPEAFLLSSALTLPDPSGELERPVSLALSRHASIAACYASRQPGRASRISLTADGHASYQVYDPELTPLRLADAAREALLIDCAATRWAAAALATRDSHSWQTLGKTLGQTRSAPPWAAAHNSPAWGGYVPDVFGMQLLTDEHLRRAADLSAWTVTEAAPGRHLVEARNPADWFGPAGPSAQTLAAARADFGAVIAPADLPGD